MIVTFFIFSGSTGLPLSGVSASFTYFKRRNEDGTITDLADPAVEESEDTDGLYEFNIPDASLLGGSIINYVVDCGALAATRYLQGQVDSDAAVEDNELVVGPGIQVFGVTTTTVKQDHFPQWTGMFSATSNPTATTVTRWIQEEAAELSGRLRLKGLVAATLATVSDVDAYAWCQKTISLAAAIRCAKVIFSGNPDFAKVLQADLDRRYELLDKHGAEALGIGADTSDDTDEPEGPTSHIDVLDLDVGEDGNESQLVPVLRRDDMM